MAVSTKASWLLPTNTENLQMMIAQGLICDVNGFVGDYYKDILSNCPGFLPLYKSKVPLSAISAAKAESNDLTPCLLKIDLNAILEGNCFHTRSDLTEEIPSNTFTLSSANQLKIEDIKRKRNDELDFESILIQGPLPLSCIDEVIFMSKSDIEEFKSSSSNLGNVPTGFLVFKSQNAAFGHDIVDSITNNKFDCELCYKKIDYKKSYSFGGLLALAFYFSKNGVNSSEMFNSITELEVKDESHLEYKWIMSYFRQSDEINELQRWNNILDEFNEYKKRSDIDFKKNIIEFLKSDSKTEGMANFLLDYHRSKIELSDEAIISKYIKEYKDDDKKFRIKLILFMFFFKDSIEKLIKYHHKDLSENDYMSFGMLFGMNYGYIGIPKWLLEYEGMQLFISSLMANYAHGIANTEMRFKKSTKPLCLPEMLSPKKLNFIAWFCKAYEFNQCFDTVMPKRDYRNIGGKCIYDGVILPEYQILKDNFFRTMSKLALDTKDYNRISKEFRTK